jgi:eukaryotic-like serine/threonine-protein kinase
MRAILKEEPPELPDSVPSVVRQVVIHCLEKKPENRFQSARDLSFALSAMSQGSGGSSIQSGVPAPSPWPKRAVLAAAALVLIAAGVAGGRVLWKTPAAPEWSGEILGGPEMALDPRISPTAACSRLKQWTTA